MQDINEPISVEVVLTTPDMNEACSLATAQAIRRYAEISDGQWSTKILFEKVDAVHVRFKGYTCRTTWQGYTHVYEFSAWTTKE